MKIALLTTYLALGDDIDSGIGQHYRILADELTREGHVVSVFYLCKPEATSQAIVDLNTLAPAWRWEVVTAPSSTWVNHFFARSWPAKLFAIHLLLAWQGCRSILSANAKNSYDIIETHSYNYPGILLAFITPRPLLLTRVSTTLGQMNAISPIQSRMLAVGAWIERLAIGTSDALVTHSRQHRDCLCNSEHLIRSQFNLVAHGLPTPSVVEPNKNSKNEPIEFLYVGRFERRKGIDILLAAIPQVAEICPQAIFTLVGDWGDGEQWASFQSHYPHLAHSRVKALGRVCSAELNRLYQQCSVFVAPSRYESFGLIYAEAMSYAKPVIGCRVGGITDVVTEEVTGLLADPGDVPSLIDCMQRLYHSATLRITMGRAARVDFLQRFSSLSMTRNSTALYRDLVTAFNRNLGL